MGAAEDAFKAAQRLIAEAKRSAALGLSFDSDETHALAELPEEISDLSGLMSLDFNDTGLADLTPLAGLTALRRLWLKNTGVTDLTPLAGMMALTDLWLRNTPALDLRPLLPMRNSLLPKTDASPSATGVTFKATAATRADPELARIADIDNDRERNQQLFDYLEGWEPPGTSDDDAPEPDALISVSLEGGRLDIAASHPTQAERDERLKRALHERLRPKASELAQLAGNRFPRLAARAWALMREVEKPFEDLDMILIHMEVDDLTESLARKADREGEEAYTPDVVDALSDVARVGPGLTLDHPDVELLEERKRRYAADPPGPEEKAAQGAMSQAVAGDEAAIGDQLREMEGRILESVDGAVAGALQRAMHRNILWRIGAYGLSRTEAVVIGVGTGIVTPLYGPALTEFIVTNWAVMVEVASSYGPRFSEWFVASVGPVPELRARLPEVNFGTKRGDKGHT